MKRGFIAAVFLIFTSLMVAVFVTSFNSFRGRDHPCEQVYYDPTTALVADVPSPLIFPCENCNCTVSYNRSDAAIPQLQVTPSLSCAPAQVLVEKEIVKEIVVKEVVKEVERECDPVPWHANKTWHYPARFPLCSMDACFNYSRCENASSLLMYAYNTPRRFFNQSKPDSNHFTSDPEKACIFLVFLDDNETIAHPSAFPHWNGGLNHALVSFADKWPLGLGLLRQETIGNASVIATDVHETTYRAGFDISIPIPGITHMREIQGRKATDRKYLATFKGVRYMGNLRSWNSFRIMHNGIDVIVATSCKHEFNDVILAKEPLLGFHCVNDATLYGSHDWVDLMNSTFGFVPAGLQPASSRFIEVLSAGVIPVLIADNYVKPFDSLIQWYKCLLQFPTSEIHRIVVTLRAMKGEEILKRQQNCIAIYREFLQDDETLLRSSVRALKARFLGAVPGLSEV